MSAYIEKNYNEIKLTKTRENVKIQRLLLIQMNFKNNLKKYAFYFEQAYKQKSCCLCRIHFK